MKEYLKKYQSVICIFAAVCLLGAAAFCGFHVYDHYAHQNEQTEAFEEIADKVEQAQEDESQAPEIPLTEEESILPEYGELFLQNLDMVGWIKIEGTNINYLVIQTPNEPNFYLKHNFEKEYSDLGVPYIQEDCDIAASDNLIIYGHHIKGQKMFGALEEYKSQSFYKYPPTSGFGDTLLQIVGSRKSPPTDGVIASFYNDHDPFRKRPLMLLFLMEKRKNFLILSMMILPFLIFLNTTILLFRFLIGKMK